MNKVMKIIILGIMLVLTTLGTEKLPQIESKLENENIKIEEVEIKKEESKVINVTDENFEEEVLKSKKIVLVDIYATWCKPCQELSPTIEEIAKERKDIKVVKIDIDKAPEIKQKYEIKSVPTLMVIKNGEVKSRDAGNLKKEVINQMVDKVKN